jgi:Tol biopolymer transport system component
VGPPVTRARRTLASLGVGLVVGVGAASDMAFAAAPWNVEDTGQPFVDTEFSVTEGTWMSVNVSPDGRTLAFDLLGDIYAMPVEGGEARLVHGGPAMQRDPRFSPDGRSLLYVSDATGGDNAWTSDADGSGARPVTSETVNSITGPSWGPDGTFIAAARLFSSDDKLHAAELRLFDPGGGSGRLLVPAPANGENVHEPQFSRDGRYLYYTEKVSDPARSVVYVDANHIHYAIKRRELASGATEELVKGFGSATTPQLSPDGRRMAFIRRVQTKTVLFFYDLATGEQRPVYDGLDRDAQADYSWQGSYYPQYDWFPDGRHVAIWGKGRLWKVDMDDGSAQEIPFRVTARHRITTPPRYTHDLAPGKFTVKAIRQAAFAPTGEAVVFNALGRLWRKAGPSAPPARLSRTASLEFEPAYSPDGRWIAYVEWSDEQGGVLKLAAAGGGIERTLLRSGGVLRSPAFSADGAKLLYKVDDGDRCLGGHEARVGIYWMDLKSGASHYVTVPGAAPMFSPDGRRIYYSVERYVDHETVTSLESVALDGQGRRVHAITRDADTSELRLSPDLRWLAFRDRQQYYVARYRETGTPVLVDTSGDALPVARVSDLGGYGLVWSADSRRLHWTLGEIVYGATVAEVFRPGEPLRFSTYRIGLEVASDVPAGEVAFVGARILTLSGAGVIEGGTLLVRGNRIAAVGAAGEVRVPATAKVIDVSGKTLMPGLIDMHGHINNCYYTSSGLMPQKQQSRYADLAYGVTTNYDPYTSELPSYSQSEMTLSGDMVGPRAIESGFIAFGRSGKGDNAFLPVGSYEDARVFMARKRELGGIIVKSYRQPMRSQRQMLIKAGRDLGVMVDVEGESNFFNDVTMILDGNTNLQHNMPVANYYDDVVQLMKRGGTPHTPTLVIAFGELFGENYIYQHMRVWDDPKAQTFVQVTTSGYSPLGPGHYAPPHVRGLTTIHAADEIYDIGFRSVSRSMKKLDDAGVVINAGSHGELSGLAQHWEMWLLAEGGMSNERVLRAATINGARTLGLDGQIGTLEAGKLADLIVLDADPLDDIRNSNTVRYTMVNGRLYDSRTMNEIGHYDRPRGKFYWEAGRTQNIVDWKKAWAHP